MASLPLALARPYDATVCGGLSDVFVCALVNSLISQLMVPQEVGLVVDCGLDGVPFIVEKCKLGISFLVFRWLFERIDIQLLFFRVSFDFSLLSFYKARSSQIGIALKVGSSLASL